MPRNHPEVRLYHRAFTKQWEVVRFAKGGRVITDRWPLHADDSAWLEALNADLSDPEIEYGDDDDA